MARAAVVRPHSDTARTGRAVIALNWAATASQAPPTSSVGSFT